MSVRAIASGTGRIVSSSFFNGCVSCPRLLTVIAVILSAGNNLMADTSAELLSSPEVRGIISGYKIFWTGVFMLGGYFLVRFMVLLLRFFARKQPRKALYIQRFIPIVRMLGWTLVVYIIITGIIQPPVQTVVAFFASIGVAVGFASQDLLKNIFGGLVIMFDRPFQVGDKIETGKYYGEVLEIGLRTTRIVTPDDSIVSVPNGEMMNQSISNANSGENNCQVVAEIILPADIDTKKVRKLAIESAQVSKYVYLNKPIAVEFFHDINPKGTFLRMRLKAYVLDVRDEFPFKSEMTEIVLDELYKSGLISS